MLLLCYLVCLLALKSVNYGSSLALIHRPPTYSIEVSIIGSTLSTIDDLKIKHLLIFCLTLSIDHDQALRAETLKH